MLNARTLSRIFSSISELMEQNRDYLVRLDQVNGDGDLGISMDDGFRAAAAFFAESLESGEETDLGRLLRRGGKVLNEAAPSSLGTILAFGLMGMAKRLRGNKEVDVIAVQNMMDKAESKPGEKTIIDALVPGVEVLRGGAARVAGDAEAERALLRDAAAAAAAGSEATRQMEAVHGRAAYSAERSIGVLDGGSVVGRLIFAGIASAPAETRPER